MILFENEPKSFPKNALYIFGVVILIALLLAAFMGTLSLLLLWIYKISAQLFNFPLILSSEVEKSNLTVCAAIGGALLTLYGVHLQKISTDRRHKIDSALALKKDIFLQVAEAISIQHQYLISFADKNMTMEFRQQMLKEHTKAFFKLQLVAEPETISAMLDSNEEWATAMFNVIRFSNNIDDANGPLSKVCDIQTRMTPFMHKLWKFNVALRKEIECSFADDKEYLAMMDAQFERAKRYFENLNLELLGIKK